MCLFIEVLPHLHDQPRDQRRNIAGHVSGQKAKKYLGTMLETMNGNQILDMLLPQVIADADPELAEIRRWASDRCAEMYPVTDWSYLEFILVSEVIMLMLRAKGVNNDRLKLEIMINNADNDVEKSMLIGRRASTKLTSPVSMSKEVRKLTMEGFKSCIANCRVFDIPLPASLQAMAPLMK